MTKRKTSTRVDGEITRQRILEAAGRLFAENGFAETTSKSIATEAGVDLASINYHFGSRNGLYQKVLAEAHSSIIDIDKLHDILQRHTEPKTQLKSFIALLCDSAGHGKGWQAQTLAREILAPTSNLSILFSEELEPKIMLIKQLISKITNIPVASPEVSVCLINIMAPCIVMILGGTSIPGPLHEASQLPQTEIINHFYRFAIAGLDATAEHYQKAHA